MHRVVITGMGVISVILEFADVDAAGLSGRNDAQRLVQAMGGEISLESEPNRGSTFSFILRFPQAAELRVPVAAPLGMWRGPRHDRWELLRSGGEYVPRRYLGTRPGGV